MDAMAGKGSITIVYADRVVHDALLGERIFNTCMPLTLLEKMVPLDVQVRGFQKLLRFFTRPPNPGFVQFKFVSHWRGTGQ